VSRAAPRDYVRIFGKIRVDRQTGCWVWLGYTSDKGYGQVWFRGRMHWVHKLVYELLVGPVPGGLEVHHEGCRNTSCCNPQHLEPRTKTENVIESNSRRRQMSIEELPI
jgi:hypothetical protein